MNISDGGRREVVVDDEVDAAEVDTPAHQLRADQYPDAAHTEAADHVVSLKINVGIVI